MRQLNSKATWLRRPYVEGQHFTGHRDFLPFKQGAVQHTKSQPGMGRAIAKKKDSLVRLCMNILMCNTAMFHGVGHFCSALTSPIHSNITKRQRCGTNQRIYSHDCENKSLVYMQGQASHVPGELSI
jgi:hypothetical protein